MKRSGIILSVTALLLAVLALCATFFNNSKQVKYVYESSATPLHQVQLAESTWPDFTFAAENAVKAVVHVRVVKRGQESPPSIFDFFFGYGSTPQQPREMVGSGAGVIISPDGYIVTNNHVVENADEVVVTLENNRTFTATVVGTDPVTDVALLRIDAEGLPFLQFGDSDALRLGQWVLAIGNPYNLNSTITAGIVSAKGRNISDDSYGYGNNRNTFNIESFIQTDAAVNAGNSGGALITVSGELVGINTAIASRTGSFAGYSFAIPTSIVKKVVDDIRQFGVVQRATLDISMLPLTDELAKENGIESLQGVYVSEIVSGGAADKAGVKGSDVLLSINGVRVNSSSSVQEQINRYRPDDKVNLTVLRNGKEINLNAVLQSRAENEALALKVEEGYSAILGAELQPIDRELREQLRIRSGLEVVSLIHDGRLQKAGVEKGFVITYVNQTAVTSMRDLENILRRSQRRGLLVEGKYPDGTTSFYAIPY